MNLKCKAISPMIGIIIFAIACSGYAYAQEDEKGSTDHPLISRIPGSYIITYELKKFNEYQLPLGKLANDTLENKLRLEGKVTQITYAAPKDRSILEIYRNYESFLKNAGFSILFTGKKSDLGEGWINTFIAATPRPYRYGMPSLSTRMEGDFTYLVAKLSRDNGDVYVALCVATSWYQDFPVIQLDVVESVPMNTGMIQVTPKTEESTKQKTENPVTDQNMTKVKKEKSIDVRFGHGGFSFTEPILAGSSTNFYLTQTSTSTGGLEGFRVLTGPYLNVRYFYNENFALSADINYLASDEYVNTTERNYASKASMFYQKIGLTAQFIGKATPVRLSTTFGAGHCLTDLYQKAEVNPPYSGTNIYLKGKANMMLAFFSVDVLFPIYRQFFLFGNYEINFIPYDDFTMKHDGGSDYTYTLYSTNFGGHHIRFGVGYNF